MESNRIRQNGRLTSAALASPGKRLVPKGMRGGISAFRQFMFDILYPLPEGTEMTPVYKTEEEYQEFRERYMEEVIPKLKEYELAHARICSHDQEQLDD